MTAETKWQWFGSSGHYICGRWCRFHLCTKVGRFLVSTVGEFVHPRHGKGTEQGEADWLEKNWPGEDIGYKRKYETMVFKAGEPCVVPKCGCGMPKAIMPELDVAGYNTAAEATKGHMRLCRKWARK